LAVTSVGPYASLHLAPDRLPRQHPTSQCFTGQMPFLPRNQQRQSTEGVKIITVIITSSSQNYACVRIYVRWALRRWSTQRRCSRLNWHHAASQSPSSTSRRLRRPARSRELNTTPVLFRSLAVLGPRQWRQRECSFEVDAERVRQEAAARNKTTTLAL